jgi:signal peptidase I
VNEHTDPVVVISRRTLRRGVIALIAVLILVGVGLGAFFAGRSTAPTHSTEAKTSPLLPPPVHVTGARTFLVDSTAMYPTLQTGDHIVVRKLGGSVAVGAVVVFRRPANDDCGGTPPRNLVQRVLGLPGQTIQGKDGAVFIDGKRLAEYWLPGSTAKSSPVTNNFGPVKVPTGDYFVMGDNRTASCDSRDWGPLPGSLVVGQVTTLPVDPLYATTTTTTAPPDATTSPPPTTTTASNPALAVLAPATVPPVSAECTIAVTISADGNASPQLCANGGVNVAAWNWYRNSYGSILALGPDTSETSVIAAMCAASPPYPEIENAAKLAGSYYGWSFAGIAALSQFPFVPTASSNECGT